MQTIQGGVMMTSTSTPTGRQGWQRAAGQARDPEPRPQDGRPPVGEELGLGHGTYGPERQERGGLPEIREVVRQSQTVCIAVAVGRGGGNAEASGGGA